MVAQAVRHKDIEGLLLTGTVHAMERGVLEEGFAAVGEVQKGVLTRTVAGDSPLVRIQDESIEFALAGRERATDGIGAGDITGVVAEPRADVHDDRIPGAEWLIVVLVVEDGSIDAAADDGGEPQVRAAIAKCCVDSGLDLVFMGDAVCGNELARRALSLLRDGDGLA